MLRSSIIYLPWNWLLFVKKENSFAVFALNLYSGQVNFQMTAKYAWPEEIGGLCVFWWATYRMLFFRDYNSESRQSKDLIYRFAAAWFLHFCQFYAIEGFACKILICIMLLSGCSAWEEFIIRLTWMSVSNYGGRYLATLISMHIFLFLIFFDVPLRVRIFFAFFLHKIISWNYMLRK